MYTDKDNNDKISINDLTSDEAELVQAAVMQLVERTNCADHARTLRRLAMQIDKQLTK